LQKSPEIENRQTSITKNTKVHKGAEENFTADEMKKANQVEISPLLKQNWGLLRDPSIFSTATKFTVTK
jgi:hypothetical protein